MGDRLTMIRVGPRLKGKIAKRVEREQRSMNDVVVSILAEHYGEEFTPVGRTVKKPVGPTPELQLKMPGPLFAAITFDADAHGDSIRNRIVWVLSEHFKVPYEATARWPERAATRT